MLVELLRHGGIELSRRWIGALLVVPASEREGVVEAVERQIIALYAADAADDTPIAPPANTPGQAPAKPKARRIDPSDSDAHAGAHVEPKARARKRATGS
ncbi:MAG: hypothetical protein AB7G11_09020 [Phycisphaerales bacterium]